MENDVAVERELEQMRRLLVHDEPLPLGLVSRLEAGVHRDQTASQPLGWEVRLGVACVCFAAVSLWSQAGISASLVAIFALIALVYPVASSRIARDP